ncbi:hypothetical protein HRbin25_00184 [bacterium HR25]|jgi:sirohydrochlorin ferrochelatase|nr:hypothetical protein HRbin25_00184 [bacterium HR25]
MRLLASGLADRLGGDVPVGVAYLEAMRPTLAEAAAQQVGQGVDCLLVQPFLLGEGQHPLEARCLAQALRERWPGLQVALGRPLARHPLLLEVLLERLRGLLDGEEGPWGVVLVKAFTRLKGGDLGWLEELADGLSRRLGPGFRVAAAQSGPGPPSIAQAAATLAPHVRALAVFPCLFFEGKIWGRDIAPAVESLRKEWRQGPVVLGRPLGVDERITAVVWERVRELWRELEG